MPLSNPLTMPPEEVPAPHVPETPEPSDADVAVPAAPSLEPTTESVPSHENAFATLSTEVAGAIAEASAPQPTLSAATAGSVLSAAFAREDTRRPSRVRLVVGLLIGTALVCGGVGYWYVSRVIAPPQTLPAETDMTQTEQSNTAPTEPQGSELSGIAADIAATQDFSDIDAALQSINDDLSVIQ